MIESLKRIAVQVRAADANVRSITLFGSLARNTCTPRSDADILIILDKSADRFVDRMARFLLLFAGSPVSTDIFPYTEDEAARTPFAVRARNEGIVLA